MAGLLLLGGCGEDKKKNTEAEAQALIDEACHRSRVGRLDDVEPLLVRLDALEGAEATAAYARTFFSVVQGVNKLAFLVATGRTAVSGAFGTQAEGASDLTGIVHQFFGDLEDVAFELQTELDETIAKHPKGRVKVTECVFYFGQAPIMSFTGELDVNEFRAWQVLVATFRSVLNVVLAQDLGVDVLGGLEIVSRITNDPICQPNVLADKRCIMQLLAWVLERYPRFLAVAEPGGHEAYLRTREAVETTVTVGYQFIEAIAAETDDQSDDFLIAENVKRGDDGAIESMTLVFQNSAFSGADIVWFNESFYNDRLLVYTGINEFRRVEIPVDRRFMESLSRIGEHFASGGAPADMQEFLLPYVQIASPIIEAFLFDQIDAVLETYDPDGTLRQGLATSGFNLSDVAVLMLKTVIPRGFISLDFYGFTGSPVPLREFFPEYDYQVPGDATPTLAVEWECGLDETQLQVCVTPTVDQAHFTGYPYEIEADGIAERYGYYAIRNPSFGGKLLVDVAAAPQTAATVKLPIRPSGPEHAAGPVKPDNYVLNFALHRVTAYIISLAEGVE